MPATTAKGYPYPLGTDPARDGDDAIKALAQAVDDRVGNVATGATAVSTTADEAVNTFNVAFPAGRFAAGAVPRVVVQSSNPSNVSATQYQVMWVSGITAAGMTINVKGNYAKAFTCIWHAIDAP